MKETRYIQGTVVKIAKTDGGLHKVALKVKDGYRIAVLQAGATPPPLQSHFREGRFAEGTSLDDTKTYYQQPEPMKGDTTYVPSDDLGQKAPTEGSEVVVKTQKELVQMLALSAEDATRIVCAAFVQAKGDSSQMDFFAQDMKKMIKKVMLAS